MNGIMNAWYVMDGWMRRMLVEIFVPSFGGYKCVVYVAEYSINQIAQRFNYGYKSSLYLKNSKRWLFYSTSGTDSTLSCRAPPFYSPPGSNVINLHTHPWFTVAHNTASILQNTTLEIFSSFVRLKRTWSLRGAVQVAICTAKIFGFFARAVNKV